MATGPDCPQLTIETLKRETGVTDEQLVRRVDKTVFKKLAGKFDNWEKYVESPGLDLEPGQIVDLKKYCYEHGNEMAMYRALELWQKKNPYFTYQSLLEVLLELGEGSLADQVCRVIASEISLNIVAQVLLPTLKSSTVTRDPNQSVDTAMEIVSQDEYMEVTTDEDSSPVAGNVHKFESRFITLRTKALNEITANGVSVKEFRRRLMTMPSSISGQHRDFIIAHHPLFEKAESIETIFLHLSFYLSYIDFSLLKHIIDQFCSENLKREMTRYAKDMRQFRSETTIEEVLPHLPEAPDCPKDYSKLEVKVNFDVFTATLEEIDQFRKTFAKSFKLSELLFYLSNLKKGSLLVTWLVPIYLGEELKEIIREKDFSFFLKINVLKLSMNGECLYPPRAEAQTSGASSIESQVISKTMLKGTKKQEIAQSIKSSPVSHEPRRRVKQQIVNRISQKISSTRCRGLVIQSTLETEFSELSWHFENHLNYAVETTTDLSDTLNAVAHHVDLPKHYPIVVLVEGDAVIINQNLLDVRASYQVNISQNIIEPLLPPNAPELVNNPKIFLITSLCNSSVTVPSLCQYDSPELTLPSKGNFIVFYAKYRDSYMYHVETLFSSHLRDMQYNIEKSLLSIREELDRITHTSTTIISRLTAPVFLDRDPPQLLEANLTSSASKEAQPLVQQTFTATHSNKKSVPSDKESD